MRRRRDAVAAQVLLGVVELEAQAPPLAVAATGAQQVDDGPVEVLVQARARRHAPRQAHRELAHQAQLGVLHDVIDIVQAVGVELGACPLHEVVVVARQHAAHLPPLE